MDSRLEKGHSRLSEDERWSLFIHMESWGAGGQGAHRQAPFRDTGSLGVHRAWGWPPGRDFSTCFTVNMCPTKRAGFCPSQGHILLELNVDLGWSWTLFQPLALLLARCCGVLRGSAPSLSSEVAHYFSICCDQESVTLTTWASVSSLEKFI